MIKDERWERSQGKKDKAEREDDEGRSVIDMVEKMVVVVVGR